MVDRKAILIIFMKDNRQGKIEIKMDLVLNVCISSSQDVEDGGSRIQGHSQPYS